MAFFVLLSLSFSQNENIIRPMDYDNFEKEWKEINDLESKGLPQSAAEKVDALYTKAKRTDNAPQIIKCLIYQGKYTAQLNEDGTFEAINKWEKELSQLKSPAKPILQSVLAEAYQKYLQQNRWTIQNRTNTVEKSEDLKTWTIEQLLTRAGELFEASLEDESIKSLNIKDFEAIYTSDKESDASGLRPTLYDFLAHRALTFYKNEQNTLTKPSYSFELDDVNIYKDAARFAQHDFATKDDQSFKYRALILYQKLIKFHLNDEKPEVLVEVDLERLSFVHAQTNLDRKRDYYEEALRRLSDAYEDGEPVKAQILYRIAINKFENAQADDREKVRQDGVPLKIAVEICTNIIDNYGDAYGVNDAKQLRARILQKSLNVNFEQVNLPNQPFLGLITYKNVKSIHVRLVRLNEKRKESLESIRRNGQGAIANYLKDLPYEKSYFFGLPKIYDHRTHTIEVAFDGLDNGEYIAILATDKAFELEGNAIGYSDLKVSNIGYWQRDYPDGMNEFVVYNRTTGEPLKNACAKLLENDYNRLTRTYKWKQIGERKTDKDGIFTVKVAKRKSFKTVIIYKNDTLDLQNQYRSYERGKPSDRIETRYFTDRAIYRPGQTIYFKGIHLKIDSDKKPSILPKEKITVTFLDANRQKVTELELQTNEYGTFNGSFVAPKGGLTGNMRIKSANGSKNIKVEEYKRPKFEVKFEPIKESYALNDAVKVTGTANALAGNVIDGAKVSYTVTRQAQIPWWYRWCYPYWRPSRAAQQITKGETTTDEKGQFIVNFEALYDQSVDLKTKPEFIFTINADVTDITGETRSSSTTMKVGTVALDIKVDIADKENANALKALPILAQNLNGEYEPATGMITLAKLVSPAQPFHSRYWEKPEFQLLREEVYRKQFPNFAYKDEDDPLKWSVERTILDTTFDTEKSKEVPFGKAKLLPGTYKLTLKANDKYGKAVDLQRIIEIYDNTVKVASNDDLVSINQNKASLEPGETASLYLKSIRKNAKVLVEYVKQDKIISREWLTLKGLETISQKIEEADRGGVNFYISTAANNRYQCVQKRFDVPWSNKELQISYGTFRDKMKPGSKEEWQMTIKGPKGEQVAAEMLVGMYDASLDQFVSNNWNLNLYESRYSSLSLSAHGYNSTYSNSFYQNNWQPTQDGRRESRVFPRLDWFNFNPGNQYYSYQFFDSNTMRDVEMEDDAPMMKRSKRKENAAPEMAEMKLDVMNSGAVAMDVDMDMEPPRTTGTPPPPPPVAEEVEVDQPAVQVRTNLKETVFFYPNLETDKDGNLVVKFTMNEALTRWKFMGLAHTKDLKVGVTTKEVVTQKELMVVPNPPRFFRERDEIEYSAKVVNLTEGTLSGNAELQLVNPMDAIPVFKWLDNPQFNQNFKVEAGQSARLAWTFKVPDVTEVPVIEHTVMAVAGEFSDAERSVVPVLTNRMLVTETMPLPVKGGERKEFVFGSMQRNTSNTLSHERYTLEFTSNPVWYAVQSLPYLMEYPYDCTEQIFSRYYANSLATSVANSHPNIKQVFDSWKFMDEEALQSNLHKNEELKSALIEETPWVMAAQSEDEQKKNIALLFDLNRMGNEQALAMKKLQERQSNDGGFAWFPGGRDSWYITQHLLEGLAHLHQMGVQDVTKDKKTLKMIQKAMAFCDRELQFQYMRLEKRVNEGKAKWEDDHLDNIVIHYLYMRSFYLENGMAIASEGGAPTGKNELFQAYSNKKTETAIDYYKGQAAKYWLKKGKYQEGLIGLALHRFGDKATPKAIAKSLRERALSHDELGRYWKSTAGYNWYELPIETHSTLIELFATVDTDASFVEDLKIWLLKNKQTTHWKTTKATASAIYALLNTGDNWILESAPVEISTANSTLNAQIASAQKSAEAGTGYFKTSLAGEDITKDLAKVTLNNPNKSIAWGAAYWQYFEDLDRVEHFEDTPLKLSKKLFKIEKTDTGEQLVALDKQTLKPGDKLKVRIELRVDRAMEYVHMKDMRASGLEPLNVFSQYKWQDGLGYYESTKDASTNFFFSYLPQGTYVFEYPLIVQHNGDFSNGVTTIQCMYAPEFTAHSEGVRVKVGE